MESDIQAMMDHQAAAFVPFLRQLPLRPEKRSELELLKAGRELHLAQSLGAFKNSPGEREAGTAKTAEELASLGDAVARLQRQVLDLPREAGGELDKQLARLPDCPNNVPSLWSDLFHLLMAIGHAEAELSVQTPTPARRGRKHNHRAEYIGRAAASIYEKLTGLRATRSTVENEARGPYLRFLQNLLDALGEDASAESVAKVVERDRRIEGWADER